VAFTRMTSSEIDIYIAGSDLYRITDSPGLDAMPVWTEDSGALSLAFVSERSGNAELYLIDSEENTHQITDMGVTVGFPDWTSTSAAPSVDFSAYTSSAAALSFRYPSDWQVEETALRERFKVKLTSPISGSAIAIVIGEVWLTEDAKESDPAAIHKKLVQGITDKLPFLQASGKAETNTRRGIVEITQSFSGDAKEGKTLYLTLKTIVNHGRAAIFSVSAASRSGQNTYAPVTNAILDSVTLQPAAISLDAIDFTSPTAVLEAVFASASLEDFSVLPHLCDPQKKNDVVTKDICGMTTDHKFKETFTQYYAAGRIVGEVEYIEGSKETFARVKFLYGPDGDLPATMEFIQRDGLWYLLDQSGG
jgi:hypothetical protein